MNGKYLAGIVAGIAGMALSVQAQTYNTQNNTYNAPEQAQTAPPEQDHWHYWHDLDREHLYHDCELSIDLFGVGYLHSHDFNNGALARHNLKFGGGAGVNFFLTKCLGIGGDFGSTTFKHSFVNTTTGNLIFRFPIGDTGLAPYIFGGAGYQFQGIDQIIGGGGLGLEFRLAPHFGIFVDGRYLAAVKTEDFGEGRAGVRLSF
jgi:hypothetical protein